MKLSETRKASNDDNVSTLRGDFAPSQRMSRLQTAMVPFHSLVNAYLHENPCVNNAYNYDYDTPTVISFYQRSAPLPL